MPPWIRRRGRTDLAPSVATAEFEFGESTLTIASSDPDDEYFAAGFGIVPTAVSVAQTLLPPDAVVFDVGANIGACAAAFATIAPRGTIHAFEPGDRTCGDLRTTVALNELAHVRCHQVALGAHDGRAVLLVPEWNMSGAFISGDGPASGVHADNAEVASVEVDVRSVDSVVDEMGIDRLDLVKIDVEGHEDAVIEGAARTLERFRPVSIIEFNVFTLAVFAGRNPMEFLVDVVDRFPHVLAIDVRGVVQPIDSLASIYGLTHRCFTSVGLVDLVCSWDEIAPETIGTPGAI